MNSDKYLLDKKNRNLLLVSHIQAKLPSSIFTCTVTNNRKCITPALLFEKGYWAIHHMVRRSFMNYKYY